MGVDFLGVDHMGIDLQLLEQSCGSSHLIWQCVACSGLSQSDKTLMFNKLHHCQLHYYVLDPQCKASANSIVIADSKFEALIDWSTLNMFSSSCSKVRTIKPSQCCISATTHILAWTKAQGTNQTWCTNPYSTGGKHDPGTRPFS